MKDKQTDKNANFFQALYQRGQKMPHSTAAEILVGGLWPPSKTISPEIPMV